MPEPRSQLGRARAPSSPTLRQAGCSAGPSPDDAKHCAGAFQRPGGALAADRGEALELLWESRRSWLG
eukprot:11032866-Alexandrium_andersonii.AAC.1